MDLEGERAKISIVVEGGAPGVMRYQYIHLRGNIGHYVEYLYYLGDGGLDSLKAILRNI